MLSYGGSLGDPAAPASVQKLIPVNDAVKLAGPWSCSLLRVFYKYIIQRLSLVEQTGRPPSNSLDRCHPNSSTGTESATCTIHRRTENYSLYAHIIGAWRSRRPSRCGVEGTHVLRRGSVPSPMTMTCGTQYAQLVMTVQRLSQTGKKPHPGTHFCASQPPAICASPITVPSTSTSYASLLSYLHTPAVVG